LTRKDVARKMARRGSLGGIPENWHGTGTQRRGTSNRTSASR